jgi:hypothetical protein
MPKPVVEVKGRAQLVRTMRAAGVDLRDLNAANRDAAAVVSPAAAAAAPRRTGRLAATGRPAGTRTMALVRFGGAAVPYGPPIHFGWHARRIAPNPFVFEAAQRTEPQWTAVYGAAVEKILDQIKGE